MISKIQLGQVTVQPKPISQNIKVTTLIPSSPTGNNSVVGAQIIPKASLGSLVSPVASQIIPTIGISNLAIVPPLGKVIDLRNVNVAKESSVSKEPLENLTGLSSKRPEIISVFQYKPLYDDSLNKTIVSSYIDSQFSVIGLRDAAFKKLVKDLKSTEESNDVLDEQKDAYRQHINKVSNNVNTIYNATVEVENNKSFALNLRRSDNYYSIRSLYQSTYADIFSTNPDGFYDRTGDRLTLIDALKQFGVSNSSLQKSSSTKLYLQLVELTRAFLVGQEIGIPKIEEDPTTITSYGSDPHSKLSRINVASLEELKSFEDYNEVLNALQNILKDCDTIISESNPVDKCSKAFEMISRELKYSKYLKTEQTKSLLNRSYGFVVSEGTKSNVNLFFSVLGPNTTKILQDTRVNGEKSVNSITYNEVDSKAILTFEDDYLKKTNSIYTPGTAYYFDKALELTSNGYSNNYLNQLISKTNTVLLPFIDFVGRMNLLPDEGNKNLEQDDASAKTSPINLLDISISNYVDLTSNRPNNETRQSSLMALFDNAGDHFDLMAHIMMYVIYRTVLSELPQSSSFVNKSIENIKNILQNSVSFDKNANKNQIKSLDSISSLVPTTSLSINKNISTPSAFLYSQEKVSLDEIEKELRTISVFLSRTLNQFIIMHRTLKENAITNGSSYYSATRDTTLMTLFFYGLINFVNGFVGSKYSNADIIDGKTYFYRQRFEPDISSAIQKSKSRLKRSQDLSAFGCANILSILSNVRDKASSAFNALTDKKLENSINEVQTIIGDQDLLKISSTISQLTLSKCAIDDLQSFLQIENRLESISSVRDSADEFDDLNALDDAFVSEKTQKVLDAFGKIAEFSGKKSLNSRLLTVGLPSGFINNIKQSTNIENLSNQLKLDNKELDVFKINVYKTDSEYPDLVFKPITKLFEFSRFVPRNENYHLVDSLTSNSIDSLIRVIPTRNYSSHQLSYEQNYYDDSFLGNELYSFLSNAEKKELISNHITSYLLENYLKLLTGMRINELEFFIQDPDENSSPAPIISTQLAVNSANQSFGFQFEKNLNGLNQSKTALNKLSLSPINKNNPITIKSPVANLINVKQLNDFVNKTKVIEKTKVRKTFYNDTLQESKRLLSPRVFDRVFHLFVDSDDFEIDIDKTTNDEIGKRAFEQLRADGRIREITDQNTNITKYYLIDRSELKNDLIFEKYFTTVETTIGNIE